jgi:hypothetical protein
MHSNVKRVLWLAAALFALAVPASVQADSGPSQFTGYSVGAWTETLAGCVRTNVWLGADKRVSRFPPAAAEESSFLSLELEQYDMCTPAPDPPAIFVGVGDMQLDQGMLTGNMQSADLHVTVSVFENVTETRVPVELNLHWAAVGDWTKYQGNIAHFGDGVNCHSMWEFRGATLSGTVQGPGIDVSGVFEQGGSLTSSKEGCTNQ